MPERITDLTVAKAKPPKDKERLEVWDTAVPGFGLRVTANGARSWIVALRRPGSSHPVRIKLGEPGRMALKAARRAAGAALDDPAAFFAGREPAPPPRPERPVTFAALAEQFLADGKTKRGRELRPATAREYRRALLVYAKPLHAMPVREIRRADVAHLIRTVATARGAVTGMRTRAALSRFWSWLLANGLVDKNVVQGTEGYAGTKGTRVLTDAELVAIWNATAEPSDFHLIIRLCLWTGCRRGEAGGMADAELQDGVWAIPGTRTKNHRDLVLPLPEQAVEALEAWRRFVGRKLLFGRAICKVGETEPQENGFQGWSQSKRRLDDRLGFDREWDLHDLRRTTQTRLAGLGISRDVASRILNHAMGPIDEVYDKHDYADAKRDALQRWADLLDAIVSGRARSLHKATAEAA